LNICPNTGLTDRLTHCQKCERLRAWCNLSADKIPPRYKSDKYWCKPVPPFGDPRARVLVVGLAPALHGGNRTGRMFTGDRSGEWLYRALYKNRFCNQYSYTQANDGLVLTDVLITALVHCAPPANKPTPEEIQNCRPFLIETIKNLPHLKVVVALGQLSYIHMSKLLFSQEQDNLPGFGHGVSYTNKKGLSLLASYHPSQQNTFTRKLTETMLNQIFATARIFVEQERVEST